MSFDNSRYLFNPFNDYSGLVMPQGRVQLDADWNEFLAEIARRIQAGTLDIMGRAVYPATTPDAFYISPSGTPWVVNIGQGRMYVDGLLAENHGLLAGAQWDPALAELSGAPQPAPAAISGTPSIPFTGQPYFPAAGPQTDPHIVQDLPGAAGSYLFYLDVWTREVTWLEDPFTANPAMGPGILDPAVGVDTSGRLQTVWQVRWMPAAMAAGTGPTLTCGTPDDSIVWPAGSNGLLTNGVVPNTQTGDCCLTTGAGYTGLENQFYRVQVHKGGPAGIATFKWSRENASVATSVSSITQGANPGGKQATILTVASLGRDQVLNFSNGDWIELLDDNIELNGQPDPAYPSGGANTYGTPGILCQIDTVDPTTNSIYLVTPPLTNPPTASAALHTRIVRWDTSPTSPNAENPLPLGPATLQLENGLTVSFSTVSGSPGNFLSGDFWTFSARTDGSFDQLTSAPPRGTHHHYTKLSVVTFDGSGNATNTPDCRTPFGCNCEGEAGCCTVTVGDNKTSFGKFTSITQAIESLGKDGGTVCILPGQYYELVVLDGLTQVTLQGSGPQTTLYAPSANPDGTSDQSGNTASVTTESGINAIVTITDSRHIELTGFTVEAPPDMSCILLDQVTTKSDSTSISDYDPNQTNWFGSTTGFILPTFTPSDNDVKLTDLTLAASTSPAIVAVEATALNIVENRILMQDIASTWPAIYASGAEITIERNWIGLQDDPDAAANATDQLLTDLPDNFSPSQDLPTGNGGIQIGGYSTCVTILDNDIRACAFNGITLGAILLMNQATQVPGLNGLFFASATAATASTLVLPANSGNFLLAADGPIQNVRIERNRILNTGLCAIGPVGFFTSNTEAVSVANISILGNTISSSLKAALAPFQIKKFKLGYGAICLPDTQNLIAHDNTVTDFGSAPGAQVCGIYILNGEQLDISRNRIEETRDWSMVQSDPPDPIAGAQAGIAIPFVAAPVFNNLTAPGGGTNPPPLHQPGLPALRMDQNVVRVPLGCALNVQGRGPFTITGNHFASGGTIPSPAPSGHSLFLTVEVVNVGPAIEVDTPTTFSDLWGTASNPSTPTLQVLDNALSNSTSGMVHFTNNVCQLETRASGVEGVASVFIASADHLDFCNNHTWMDGVGTFQMPGTNFSFTALTDVILMAGSINVSNNRFQEVPNSVLFSGMTIGLVNTTTCNISTFCLFAETNSPPWGAFANNISIEAALAAGQTDGNICNTIAKDLLGGFGVTTRSKASHAKQTGLTQPFNIQDTALTSNPKERISRTLNEVDTASADRIGDLSLIHTARLAQVTRVAATVTDRTGSDSIHAKAAQAAVASTKANLTRIAMVRQQVSATPPAVTPTGWALYGVVNNSSNSPVSAYSLYFVDSTNTFQNVYGTAYTASDGSFQLVYPGPAAGQKAPTTPLYLQIANAAGEPIYTSPTPFTPKTGAATYQVVTLPAGEKPIGILPRVFRGITLPKLRKEEVEEKPSDTRKESEEKS